MVLTKLKKKKNNSKFKTKKRSKRITMKGGQVTRLTNNTTSRLFQLAQEKIKSLSEAKIQPISITRDLLLHPEDKVIPKTEVPDLTIPFVKAAIPFMKYNTEYKRRPSYSKIHY